MPNNNPSGASSPAAGQPGAKIVSAPDAYWRSFPQLEKVLGEERPALLDRIQATCRQLDAIVKSGTPQEKARAKEAMSGYTRALELYRELVDRRDQVIAEVSNRGKVPHDK
jgi:hypothetical protein